MKRDSCCLLPDFISQTSLLSCSFPLPSLFAQEVLFPSFSLFKQFFFAQPIKPFSHRSLCETALSAFSSSYGSISQTSLESYRLPLILLGRLVSDRLFLRLRKRPWAPAKLLSIQTSSHGSSWISTVGPRTRSDLDIRPTGRDSRTPFVGARTKCNPISSVDDIP